MAKANFYLYGSKGKVGNLVARKGPRGGTVLSERVTNPKNPRTNKQMSQRIILSTVAQAAKFLSPIVDHSFEGKARGAISKEYFRKINMNRLRKLAAIDFAEGNKAVECNAFTTTKGIEALIPNSYIVSEGNLDGSKLLISKGIGSHQVGMGEDFFIGFARGENSDINYVEGPINGAHYVTVGSVIEALLGLRSSGEQLTFVGIEKTGENYKFAFQNDPSYAGWMIPYTNLIARRLFISTDYDLDTLIQVTDNQGVELNDVDEIVAAAVKTAFTNERSDSYLLDRLQSAIRSLDFVATEYDLTIDNINWNYTEVNSADGNLGYLYALGIIRSKLIEDGSWQYSKCILSLNLPTSDPATNFGLDWNSSVQAWFQGDEVAQNPEYLQAGTDSNTIGESFT